MSVYNGERYLRESVQSILNQTFTDLELIIVEDGSVDSTWDILTRFEDGDKRIRLVQNKDNLGLPKSLNRGLALARGQYIARQDADDVSLPERLNTQIKFMEHNAKVGLLGTAYSVVNGRGQIEAVQRHPQTDTEIRWQMLFHNAFCHTSVMFSRGLLDRGSFLYDETLTYSQDYELWTRMLQQTIAANLEIPLVEWRKSDNAISAAFREEQQLAATMISGKQINRLFPGRSIPLAEVARLREWYHAFPRRPERQHMEVYLQLVEILSAFARRSDIDRKILNNISRKWIDRMLSSVIYIHDWDFKTVGMLVAMFRLNALAVLMCLTGRTMCRLKNEIKVE